MSLALIINPDPTSLSFAESIQKGGVSIIQGDLVDIDVFISEQHDSSAAVTKDPIEDGSSVSSHVVVNPDRLTLTGIISNTPIDSETARRAPPETRRAENSYLLMDDALHVGAVFTIVTSLKQYDSLVMVSLSAPRDVGRANVVEFSATFEQVSIVGALEVAAELTFTTKGDKPPPGASDGEVEAVESKSLLQSAKDLASSYKSGGR